MRILCLHDCESSCFRGKVTTGLCCYAISSCTLKDVWIVERNQIMSSKPSNNYLWPVLDVFPVVVYEKLDAFLGTSVHYVAMYSEKKQHNGASLTNLCWWRTKYHLRTVWDKAWGYFMLLLIDISKVLPDLSYFYSRQIWLALLLLAIYLFYFKKIYIIKV